MIVELIIPGDIFAALSPNVTRRLHYQEQARRRKEWKGRTIIAWRQAGCPQFLGAVKVVVTLKRGRAVDTDNATACLKAVIDGLKSEPGRPGAIRDDSPRWLYLMPVVQLPSRKYKGREEVIIQIEPAAGVLPFEEE